MATNIKSTALDFENIKNNLKAFFQAQPEFSDYNFEASGLSNILDVLAYNTHYNALIANMALNESFLNTAQLRSSLVSLSEAIGYIPDSRTSAMAQVKLSVNVTGTRPPKLVLPRHQVLYGSSNNTVYAFLTREDLTAQDNGSGLYVFTTSSGSDIIPIYEGRFVTKTFQVGQYEDALVYVIPDTNLDLSSVEVKVKQSALSSVYDLYTNIAEAITLNEVSRLYLLKESPNGYFELSFGNGTALGTIPIAGNTILVDYISTSGESANGITGFTGTLVPEGLTPGNYTSNPIVTVTSSVGGAEKETSESIRQNAPYMYATQNRMVTAADYAAMVLRYYSSFISDIAAWGGQDNVVREFGKIFLSILFNPGIPQETIDQTKTEIVQLASKLAVLSFTIGFSDPIKTYLETKISFDFAVNRTDVPLGTMQTNVKNASVDYFTDNLGKFGSVFRLSNMLSDLDDVSPSVLSSSAEILMQQRLDFSAPAPGVTGHGVLGKPNNFVLKFPVPLLKPDDDVRVVNSTVFTYNGRPAFISNELTSFPNTVASYRLQIVDNETGSIIVEDVGYYDGPKGEIVLIAFTPTSVGGSNIVKLAARPANPNTITSTNNHVIYQDIEESYASGAVVYTA